ncbi:MAG TPA: DNA-binding domain-containing protein [Bryobacteraceae bacterium]|nr:DNA-binding domain-containing protein [Bryobacteraceae bacterium]
MTLLEVQRQMAHSIMQPLTKTDQIGPRTAAGFIKANNRLTSKERLEIYSRSYWFRVLDSLYDDFPGLRAMLGQKAFHELSRAYLADCPSRSFTLRDLGARLEGWLRRRPKFSGKNHELALDMVRLEWAHTEAFDSAAEKGLGPEDLVDLGANFRARLQPYLRLLALQYPVDDLRIHVNQGPEDREAASNAVLKPKRRSLTKRTNRLKPQPIFLAVHRLNYIVYYRRLAAEEYRLLTALGAGKPIGWAIRNAFKTSSAEQTSLLEQWFAAWSQLGWLCPARQSPPNRPNRKKVSG